MSDDIQVQIDGVSKTYGRRRVLPPISAELRPGDGLLVTGQNGSGKSTLLRLLAGLQRPSSGEVRYLWRGTRFTPAQARHLFGLVGNDVQLYRELTADEHLQFVAHLRGLPFGPDRAADLLASVGLAGQGNQRVGGFSSGMAQRVRYLLALLHRPPVLLLDEPTTNLDDAGIAVVDQIVATQRQHGIVVVATNDRRDWRYGDHIIRLGPEASAGDA